MHYPKKSFFNNTIFVIFNNKKETCVFICNAEKSFKKSNFAQKFGPFQKTTTKAWGLLQFLQFFSWKLNFLGNYFCVKKFPVKKCVKTIWSQISNLQQLYFILLLGHVVPHSLPFFSVLFPSVLGIVRSR